MVSFSFLPRIWQTPHLKWRANWCSVSVLPSSSGKSDAKYRMRCLLAKLVPSCPCSSIWKPVQQCTQSTASDQPRINQYWFEMLMDISIKYFGCQKLIWNCGWFCFKINYQKPEERKALKIWVVQIPKYLYFSNLLIVYFSTTKPHREGSLLFSVKHREKLQVCECWSQRREVNLWDSLHGKITQGLCITT